MKGQSRIRGKEDFQGSLQGKSRLELDLLYYYLIRSTLLPVLLN